MREMEEMFAREEVRAIVCARGGLWHELSTAALGLGEDQGASQDFCGMQRHHDAVDIFLRRAGMGDVSRADGGGRLGA